MTLDNAGKPGDGSSTEPGPKTSGELEPTSAAEQLTSKIEAEKQYSGADVKKLVEDVLSADGREQKDRAEKAEGQVKKLQGETTELTTRVNTFSTQITDLLKASNEAEAEKVKDDPVALTSLRARQTNAAEALRLQGVVADYEAKNTKLTERETEIGKKETSINIKLAANAASVDEKVLADLVPDGDPERLKRAATILKQSSITQEFEIDPATGKPKIDPSTGKPVALTQKPASAIGAAGDSKSVSEKMLEKAKAK